jgi:hypothetical protein
MNEPRRKFQQLVQAVRDEPVPAVDVTEQVLHRLRVVRPASGVDISLWLATLLSVAAAALVMTLVGYQGAWDVDPLADLFQPFVALIR